MKTCNRCLETKDFSLFHNDKYKKDGFRSTCKKCYSQYHLKRYQTNPEKERERVKKYRQQLRDTNPQKLVLSNRKTKLKRAYGIGLEEYDKMLKAQNYKCAVCGIKQEEAGKKGLVVDHCHDSGKIRALLCSNCNSSLGLLKEDLQVLESLKNYIIKHKLIGDSYG
jgi:hypothetical protein